MTDPRIIDLDVDDPRLPELYEVLRALRTELTLEQLRSVYAEAHPQGLRYTAVEADGRIAAVAGWRIITCTTALRRLYVDDLVTDPTLRSTGHGALLLGELEQRARAAGCTRLSLESGVQRRDAHRFYFRERMSISAYHFDKTL